MNNYYLTRKRELVECEVVKEGRTRRTIKITEKGHALTGKHKTLPPDGVAVGKLYPRIFKANSKPTDIFEIDGRVMLKTGNKSAYMVPDATPYSFQRITSQVIDSIYAGDNVLLTGEAGTGKTSMIEQIASRINQPVLRVNLNGETRIGDFLGRLNVIATANGSVTEWVDGILPTAMKNGYWLILDEIDMGEPNILSLLHPILEPNGRLVLKENKGEEVKPHAGFRIFGTANGVGSQGNRTDTYAGVNQMNEAFLDRWHIITMPNLSEKVEIKVLRDRVKNILPKHAKRIVQFANMVRKGLENQAVSSGFSTRRCIQWAEKMALYRNPAKAAEAVFLCKVTPEDRIVLEKNIQVVFGGKGSRKAKQAVVDADGNIVAQAVSAGPTGRKRGRPRKVQP
jgi:cobaltochelatase CobS